jgi:hypothetical protein
LVICAVDAPGKSAVLLKNVAAGSPVATPNRTP